MFLVVSYALLLFWGIISFIVSPIFERVTYTILDWIAKRVPDMVFGVIAWLIVLGIFVLSCFITTKVIPASVVFGH